MQQLLLNSSIGTHRQLELPLGTCQAASSLDDLVPKGIEPFKGPQRSALFSAPSVWWVGDHVQFTVEIVCQDRRQYVDSIASLSPGRHIVHLDLGFELSEQPFLSATAMIKADDPGGLQCLVGDNDAVIVVRVTGLEQIKLNRPIVAFGVLAADEDERYL